MAGRRNRDIGSGVESFGMGVSGRTHPRLATYVAVLALLAVLLPGHARAEDPPAPLGLNCSDVTSPDGVDYRFCTGYVRTFDGTPLAVDLTLPADSDGSLPLFVFRHGVPGVGRVEFRSQTAANDNPALDGFNNVSMAARGYAVLTYDVRGLHDSCGPKHRVSAPASALECVGRASWYHVFDPRWDVRDAQTLIGLLVDEGVADPDAIGVAGYSAGGVETWFLAILNDRMMEPDGTLIPWTSPAGVPLSIAAASPLATIPAPLYGYAPNGRATDAEVVTIDRLHSPPGVPSSFVPTVCAIFPAFVQLAPPRVDPTADLISWCARGNAGEPFDPDNDPIVREILEQFAIRSPLAYEPSDRVPVLTVQGWRDSVATPMQAVMMRQKMLDWDPTYPITSFFGDVGHLPAVNPPVVMQRRNEITIAFFDHHLRGIGDAPAPGVIAHTTACRPGQEERELTANGWHAFATGTSAFTFDEPRTTVSHLRHPSGAMTDQMHNPVNAIILGGRCYDEPSEISTGLPGWEAAVDESFTLVGAPSVRVSFTTTGPDAQLNVRLWEVYEDGRRQSLVTRGTYRHDGDVGVPTEVKFQIEPNFWDFEEGNTLRLEILGNDWPAFQANNQPFVATIHSVDLTLPTLS